MENLINKKNKNKMIKKIKRKRTNMDIYLHLIKQHFLWEWILSMKINTLKRKIKKDIISELLIFILIC